MPNPDDNLKELSSVSVAGMTPFLKGRFDPAPLTPLLGILTQLGGGQPQLAEQIKGIMDRNLIGPEAAKWTAALGHTDDATVSTMIMSHVADGQPKDSIGLRPLSEADYNLIPADAYFGNVATLPKGTFDGVKATLESDQNIATALDNIKAETGVDVLGDLIPSIGDTVAAYISDATGGGSLASQVVIVSLADRAKFVNANGKLVTYLNQKLNDPHTARGYISIRAWKDESSGNTDFYSMRFPGVPVPVEPTYAITQNLLVIGLSPQAAVAAVRQATGKSGPGIMSNASIARDVPKGKPITSFAFNDSSKVLRAGYPFVSAFGSMVGNLVRSRDGAAGREPGMIVPVYADLAKDARPQISYAYWEGKNYISEWRGDKSLLVNMGSVVGQYSTYWPIIALGAAAAGVGAAQQQNMMNGFPGMHPMDGMDDDDHMNGDEGDDEGPEALAPATSPAPVRVGS